MYWFFHDTTTIRTHIATNFLNFSSGLQFFLYYGGIVWYNAEWCSIRKFRKKEACYELWKKTYAKAGA